MSRLNLPQLHPRRVTLDDGTTVEIVDAQNLREILDTMRDWGRQVDDQFDQVDAGGAP